MSTDGRPARPLTVDPVDGSVDPPSEHVERLPGPDVVRAIALIGVVVMNYHGYLIFRGDGSVPDSTVVERFFDPFTGPLATRFASTFVLTAGVGITLLTRRAAGSGDRSAVVEMRWRLARRGIVLYVLGEFLDVIWRGTIIVYYGAMFVVAALLFTLATRWIVGIGVAAALAGWGIATWSYLQVDSGQDVDWLTRPGRDSVRRYLFDTVINGTHPLLPWLAFFCAGIVVGRHLDVPAAHRRYGAFGVALFALATLVSQTADTTVHRSTAVERPLRPWARLRGERTRTRHSSPSRRSRRSPTGRGVERRH